MAALPPVPPRASLPGIPRELRDQIYGYLLTAEYVHAAPYSQRAVQKESGRQYSVAHTYTFHTNILGVNKNIHQEASETLYKKNQFVVVSHLWAEDSWPLEELMHRFDVPIVSEKMVDVATFEMATVHLAIGHPHSNKYRFPTSFLMLLKDLPIFAHIIQWLGLQMRWPATIHVPRRQGEDMAKLKNRDVPYDEVVKTNLRFRSNKFMKLGPEVFTLGPVAKENPLRAFYEACTQMVIPGQDLVIEFPQDIMDAASRMLFSSTMNIRLGCRDVSFNKLVAVAIDSVNMLRRTPDRLMEEGQYGRAMIRYYLLLEGVTHLYLVTETDSPLLAASSTVPLLKGLVQVIMDVAATLGFLLWAEGKTESVYYRNIVKFTIPRYFKLLVDWPDTSDIHPEGSLEWFEGHEVNHLMVLNHVLGRTEANLDLSIDALYTIQEARGKEKQRSKQYQWDLDVLNNIKSDPISHADWLSDKLDESSFVALFSPSQFPLQVYRSELPAAVLAMRPQKVVAFSSKPE